MISEPTDSTQVELTQAKGFDLSPKPPAEVRRSPPTEVRRPTEAAPGVKASAPVPDPMKSSEARRPGSVTPQAPKTAPRPAPAPVVPSEDEDPEKLLREYSDRQKTKVLRLEQQLVEYKKVVAERDAYRARTEALSKELVEARKNLEGAAKQDEIIKDLQGKLDAAILSNSILTEDKDKLKRGLAQQTENLSKSQERAAHAEKGLAESQKALAVQTETRQLAEGRIAAALHALQPGGKTSESAHAAPSVAPKPAASSPPAEKPAPQRPVAAGPVKK